VRATVLPGDETAGQPRIDPRARDEYLRAHDEAIDMFDRAERPRSAADSSARECYLRPRVRRPLRRSLEADRVDRVRRPPRAPFLGRPRIRCSVGMLTLSGCSGLAGRNGHPRERVPIWCVRLPAPKSRARPGNCSPAWIVSSPRALIWRSPPRTRAWEMRRPLSQHSSTESRTGNRG